MKPAGAAIPDPQVCSSRRQADKPDISAHRQAERSGRVPGGKTAEKCGAHVAFAAAVFRKYNMLRLTRENGRKQRPPEACDSADPQHAETTSRSTKSHASLICKISYNLLHPGIE